MVAGLHIVRKIRPGKPAVFYVYAWRGGPLIQRVEGARPKVTAELTDKAAHERKERGLASPSRSSADCSTLTGRQSGAWKWRRTNPHTARRLHA